MPKIPGPRLAAAGLAAAAFLVSSGLVVNSYQPAIRSARARVESLGSEVIHTPCGPVEYARAGAGHPVLVVHGNGGGFDQGLALARNYLGPGFEAIAPSRFGYLRTPLPENATPAGQADAYACLLDALGIRQAALVTTSAGATSAIQFALRHRQRLSALVLHSPNAPGRVEMALPPRAVLSALFSSDLAYWGLTTYLRPMMQSLVGVPSGRALTAAEQAEVEATLASVLPISVRSAGMIFDTFVSNPEINSGYPFGEIATPTLVVSAVDDPMALHENARALAAAIPGSRLLAVSDGGHIMLGHTEEVRQEITQFLRSAIAEARNGR